LLVARPPAYEEFAHRMGMLLIHRQLQPHEQCRKDSFTVRSSQCKRARREGPPGGHK
jgi:hypothetical protein